MYAPEWPDLIHPFASAIDSALPVPPSSVHLMLRYKADWVRPQFGRGDQRYSEYPELSIEARSEEHTSELQSLMRISSAVFCLKKKHNTQLQRTHHHTSSALHDHTTI